MPPKHARKTARKAKREPKPSEPKPSIKTLQLAESSVEFPPRVWLHTRGIPRARFLAFFFYIASYPFIVAACYKKYPKYRRGILGAHGFSVLLILGASIKINSNTISRSWCDFVNLLIQINSFLAVLITPKPYISAARSLKSLALQIQALQDPRNISALVPSYLVPYVQQAIDIPIWIKALVICSSLQPRYLPQHLDRILQRLIREFMDQPIWLKISIVKLFIVCSLYLLLSLSYSQSSS